MSPGIVSGSTELFSSLVLLPALKEKLVGLTILIDLDHLQLDWLQRNCFGRQGIDLTVGSLGPPDSTLNLSHPLGSGSQPTLGPTHPLPW